MQVAYFLNTIQILSENAMSVANGVLLQKSSWAREIYFDTNSVSWVRLIKNASIRLLLDLGCSLYDKFGGSLILLRTHFL